MLVLQPDRLRREREIRAISRSGLATLANVNARTIERLENGERGARVGTISRLAEALGVKPLDIAKVE